MQEPKITPRPDSHRGDIETHPAYGIISASRVSSTSGGVLFDSEVQHQHYVTIKIDVADRSRDLNRDWIHGTQQVIEVAVSESQWGKFVSSLNSGGSPCTIQYINGEAIKDDDGTPMRGRIPELPFAPRMAHQRAETVEAASRHFDKIKEAHAAFVEKPNAANKRALALAIEYTEGNIDYAARSLTEFSEKVVAKAQADIEAMMESKIRTLGLQAAYEQGLIEPMLGPGKRDGTSDLDLPQPDDCWCDDPPNAKWCPVHHPEMQKGCFE